jgi:hypothetical protein
MFSYTPYRRSHHSIFCNCQLCKQFDYADTVPCRPSNKPVTRQQNPVSVRLYEIQPLHDLPLSPGVYEVEIIPALDTVTGERHYNAIVSKVQ